MKVVTWNVNGLRAREAQLVELLQTQKPDVVCLQEIKAAPDQIPAALVELPGYWTYWHGEKGYSGVALHFAKATFPTRPEYFHPEFDHEHRIVCGRVSVGVPPKAADTILAGSRTRTTPAEIGPRVFASIYVPNGGKDFEAKKRFLAAMDVFVKDAHARGDQLVLCGDYNVARERRDVHPSLQKEQEIGQTPGERASFAGLLAHGLRDLGRHFSPDDDRLYTWWAPWRNLRQKNVGWRLDYVLVTEPWAASATSCTHSREFGTSDHGPVTAMLGA